MAPGCCRVVPSTKYRVVPFPGALYALFLKPSFISSNEKATAALGNVVHTLPALTGDLLPHLLVRPWPHPFLLKSSIIYFFIYIRGSSAVHWPCPATSVACLFCLKWFFFCFIASARTCMLLRRNPTLPDSHSDSMTKSERKLIARSAPHSSGSVNKITESLNNASVRPSPSFEGKFEPITFAPRRLIF